MSRLRRVPVWADGERTVTARLLEQASFYAMEDVPPYAQALWREHLHLGSEHDAGVDFFSPDFEFYVDDIKLRRWKLKQREFEQEQVREAELVELAGWGRYSVGSVWMLSETDGTWLRVGGILDRTVMPNGDQSPSVQALVDDFHVIRREYEDDYDYAD
jgi:hypothetical protein